ncbi:MAG: hypothetical protein GF411_16315 [Candidatus Lokiarchaeota archaeon]|nr:hypothetical protein [Candidatus Lokiarchaeota archaeon]
MRLLTKAIYRFSDLYHGTGMKEKTNFLLKSQWWSLDKLREFQLQKLKKLVKHAYTHVPYYQKAFRNAGIVPSDIKELQDLEKIPILTKDDVRKYARSIISRNAQQRDRIKGHTGGSTGLPIQLYRDRNTEAWATACMRRFYSWIGMELGESVMTVAGGSLGGILRKRNLRTMITELRDRIEGRFFIQAFSLDDKQISKIESILEKNPIRILRGYPSALWILSRFAMKNHKILKQFEIAITTAERLYDFQRSDIEEGLAVDVFDQYGSGEIYSIANQCEEKELYHINDEHLIVETKSLGFDRPELTPAIVTNLDNYTMPFIRYDLGDIVRNTSRSCKCGRKLTTLESVVGRTYDFVVSTDGKLLPGVFIPHIFRKVQGFDRFYAHQPSIELLQIKIVPNEQFKEKELDDLETAMKEFLGESVTIEFEEVEESELPQTRSGKLVFVRSEIAPEYMKDST